MSEERRKGIEAAVRVLTEFYPQLDAIAWWKHSIVDIVDREIDPAAEGLQAYFLAFEKIVAIMDSGDTDEAIELILTQIEERKRRVQGDGRG